MTTVIVRVVCGALARAVHAGGSLAMTALLLALALTVARAAEGDSDQGRELYQEMCSTCHGPEMVNSGALSPDLRKFPKTDFARFKTTVMNGKGRAMPAWAEKLSEDDIANLWAYVTSGG